MLLAGGGDATNVLIILWSWLPARTALRYTLPNFLKRFAVVKCRGSRIAHSHWLSTVSLKCCQERLENLQLSSLGVFPPQVWQNVIPDCLWSRTCKAEEGSRKTREEERKDAAGVNSCESFSGVEKRQRQKEWEAEANKNPETASWRRVAPFEYRAAAAGVCVEQLCTSHSITIRRARCC